MFLRATLPVADEPLIHRDEVVALLFNASDIAETVENIERLLGGETRPPAES
jgi:hypothetical protein